MNIRVRVVVTGRVQGVFYRASAAEQARALGVAGFVRNRADGTVEGEIEGPAAAVDAMVEWCRRGPAGANVEGVETERITPSGESGFGIE